MDQAYYQSRQPQCRAIGCGYGTGIHRNSLSLEWGSGEKGTGTASGGPKDVWDDGEDDFFHQRDSIQWSRYTTVEIFMLSYWNIYIILLIF